MAKRTRKPSSSSEGGSREPAGAAGVRGNAGTPEPTGAPEPFVARDEGGPKHLEDLLLALQKSFSRVSAMSTRTMVGEDNARALITGSVDFDLVAKFDLVYKQGDTGVRVTREPAVGGLAGMAFETLGISLSKPVPDQLRLSADGAIQLHLKGRLNTDVRVVEAAASREASADREAAARASSRRESELPLGG